MTETPEDCARLVDALEPEPKPGRDWARPAVWVALGLGWVAVWALIVAVLL